MFFFLFHCYVTRTNTNEASVKLPPSVRLSKREVDKWAVQWMNRRREEGRKKVEIDVESRNVSMFENSSGTVKHWFPFNSWKVETWKGNEAIRRETWKAISIYCLLRGNRSFGFGGKEREKFRVGSCGSCVRSPSSWQRNWQTNPSERLFTGAAIRSLKLDRLTLSRMFSRSDLIFMTTRTPKRDHKEAAQLHFLLLLLHLHWFDLMSEETHGIAFNDMLNYFRSWEIFS